MQATGATGPDRWMHLDRRVNEHEAKDLEPREDPARPPGGFPHLAVALTAAATIALAALLLFALFGRSVAGVALCFLLIPIAILLLKRESSEERG